MKEKNKAMLCRRQPSELLVKKEIVGPIVKLISDMANFPARICILQAGTPTQGGKGHKWPFRLLAYVTFG